MTFQVVREHVPQTNGDPDTLLEEATEVLVVESDPGWRVLIEHFRCDTLIQVERESYEDAVALIDRIEAALDRGDNRIRIDSDRIVSLERFRQAWIDRPSGGMRTATSPQ